MKNLKIFFLLLSIMMVSSLLKAQSLVKAPEKLQGFWHWDASTGSTWDDGNCIGADWVEFEYTIYYIDKIEEQGADGYRLWLHHESGKQVELTISALANKQAKLQFSSWNQPKESHLLPAPSEAKNMAVNQLPKALFQEWTKDPKGTLFCKFHDSNKLLYEDKEWNILSASYYKSSWYRLLVGNGTIYKTVYVTSPLNPTLLFVSNSKNNFVKPVASHKEIYQVLGNWAEMNGNHWELGFFEKFAIYKGDFWNYQSVDFKGENATIVLTKGTRQVKLSLALKSEAVCNIAVNGQETKMYLKCGKNLRAYATPDTISFKDTRFKKADTVTIKGYLRSNWKDGAFCISFHDFVKDKEVKFFGDMDSLGCFTVKIPLINTSELYLDWGRVNKVDVAEPGETYFVFFDLSTKQHLVMGDNERLHNELAGYEQYNPYKGFSQDDAKKMEALAPLEYLKVKQESLRKSYQHLNEYIANTPNLSERFKYYERNDYRFDYASELMARHFYLNQIQRERLPAEFMEYVNDSLYRKTPPLPFTLCRNFLFFIQYYTHYAETGIGSARYTASPYEVLLVAEKKGLIKLSEEDKQVLAKNEEWKDKIRDKSTNKIDSAKWTKELNSFSANLNKVKELYKRVEIKNISNGEWSSNLNLAMQRKRFDLEFFVIDSIITDPLLKELLQVKKFCSVIDYTQKGLPDEFYQLFRQKIKTPELVNPIMQLQNHFVSLEKQDIEYTASLKNTEHLKESKDVDALIAQLIGPYKGKVVYIDFWGTWCGPCKGQMKYVPEVKEALKDKEVIFMYFANNSPEDSWKNVIKENHLSGPNSVHYRLAENQESMIERRFAVAGYPTYILINKNGEVVNMKAPRPEQKEQLINEITKLLN